jgi:Smg protein
MTTSVLDILIYVFDRYMLDEAPESLTRNDLERDLERAGFRQSHVERALDWLADLSGERARPAAGGHGPSSVRVFCGGELSRLSTECRGFLMTLERLGILSAAQRELVVDRMLALDADELDTEQLKWVVLMVLSSQPGQEQAFALMEDLVLDRGARPAH